MYIIYTYIYFKFYVKKFKNIQDGSIFNSKILKISILIPSNTIQINTANSAKILVRWLEN